MAVLVHVHTRGSQRLTSGVSQSVLHLSLVDRVFNGSWILLFRLDYLESKPPACASLCFPSAGIKGPWGRWMEPFLNRSPGLNRMEKASGALAVMN